MRSQKMCVLAVLVVAAVGLMCAQTKKPLTNENVLRMVKVGFEQSMIVKAIEANDTDFDVSVEALMDLKNAGVSQPIIEAMLAAEAKKKAPDPTVKPANAPPPDPNDPMSPHESGIYWLTKQGAEKRMMRLEPSSYSGAKTGGLFATGMTMGIHKTKWKAVLPGAHAALRISEPTPEFWFYFEEKSGGLGQSSARVEATKPDDFTLARMQPGGKERQLVVGQGSITGVSAGTRLGDTILINAQKMGPGIYKVTPSKQLAPGEYCFVPPGGALGFGYAGGQLFDFGIDRAK